MSSVESEIPAGLRAVWNESGEVLRLRMLRDILGHDESFLHTAELKREVERLPEVQELVSRQSADGSWNRSPDLTAYAFLRLCELGLENSAAVQACIDKLLIPGLAKFGAEQNRARRDTILYMLARAQRPADPLVKVHVEKILAAMEQSVAARGPVSISFHGYAALCCYPWNEDESLRVSTVLKKLVKHAEEVAEYAQPEDGFRILEKSVYLTQPEQLFYELELSARAGITHSCDSTRWMFEEIEARQDADGWVRFEAEDTILPWYFPLEKTEPDELKVEWSVRAGIIFKILEYDF